MAVEKEEVDDVPHNGRGFETLLLRAVHDEVSAESSGLLDVREGGIKVRRAVRREVRERGRPLRAGTVIVLPFVDVMAEVNAVLFITFCPDEPG